MKTFLNLSFTIINKLHITEISKRTPDKYTIYLNIGFFSTKFNTIEICKKKNSSDYDQITKWIHSREDN
jgi:hypothetical protein